MFMLVNGMDLKRLQKMAIFASKLVSHIDGFILKLI